MAEQRTTNASRAPVAGDEHSLTVGPNGPTALQDAYGVQKMQHFNRERVPERDVHAKGSAAHRFLEVTLAAREAPGPRRLGPDCPPARSWR
jgi:catalase